MLAAFTGSYVPQTGEEHKQVLLQVELRGLT